MREHHSKYFCGNEISPYGIEHKRMDYRTFAKAFDAVLNNEIMEHTWEICEWEQENGIPEDYSERIDEIREQIEELENTEKLTLDMESDLEELREELNELEELQNEYDYGREVFQYYIVSDYGARLIKEYTDDPLWYNETLDMYVWGITHYGTSWDYVLMDVKLVDVA